MHSGCTSRIGDLLVIPGVRRDGSALVAKTAPVLLPALQSGAGAGAAQRQAAAAALGAAMQALPTAFRQHSKALEVWAAAALMAGASAADDALRPRAALCLALLPRLTGAMPAHDAAQWPA